MTIKECIKNVEGYMPDTDSRKLIIATLERQVPKKPIIVANYRHCGCCGTLIKGGSKFCDEFCDHCGQKIDWSEV